MIDRTSVTGLTFLIAGIGIAAAAARKLHRDARARTDLSGTRRDQVAAAQRLFRESRRNGPAKHPCYVLEGQERGGTFVLLGGTHPQEVAGHVAATLVVENVRVKKGRHRCHPAGEPQRLHLYRAARGLSAHATRSIRRTENAGSGSACGSPIPSTNGRIRTCRRTSRRASTWSAGRRAI